jgi:PAS domain S-box-containing protein
VERGSKSTILLVDDEKINLLTLSKILSPSYAVFMAKSGSQALSLVARNKPDIILLDVMMPELDGFSVLARLKADEETNHIPVIFITGRTDEQDEEKGFHLGAVDYIRKPFNSAVVRARVDTQIQLARQIRLTKDELVRLSSVAEHSPQFMAFLNADGCLEYLNPAAVNISGYSRSELVSQGMKLILSAKDLLKLGARSSPDGRSNDFEASIVRKDGSVRIINFSAFSAALHDGNVGLGLTGSDITELKQMQTELSEAKERLERALAEQEYYNRAKSDFLSRMSHEMRTPMNAILNMAHLAKTADEEKKIYCLNGISEAAGRLSGIIDDILDMVKINAEKFELSARPFHFHAAMRSVLDQISRQTQAKNQVLVEKIDRNIPVRLTADEARLKQVLLNLLSNAVKFTPSGGSIGLSADCLGFKDGRCSIRFEVSDTGIGMSASTLSRMWNAFEQADNSITRTYGGTGLGLSIARYIVRKMGGDVQVESEPDRGSRFFFTLEVDFDEGDVVLPKEDAFGAILEGRRILVVDDVEANRDIITALLEEFHAELDTAEDGSEAVHKFSENGYDVVLMDLHMPVMDGFEATKRIRDLEANDADKTKIIAVTADTGGDVIARCLVSGMNDHIGKPIDLETLVGTLALHLSSDADPKSPTR